jgi:hypothetical protein
LSASPIDAELARHQWEEGRRAFKRAAAEPDGPRELPRQVALVSAELSRRLGQLFTLADLVGLYRGADGWAPALVLEALPDEVPTRVSTAVDAAFELAARRASDYVP